MVDIRRFVGSVPNDQESEDILDADRDPEAMRRLIESAIGYMERGEPVPVRYVRFLVNRLVVSRI